MTLSFAQQLARKQLIMVGGKGGVGKTTVASALAVFAAESGRQVRLISTDPAHNLADIFEQPIGAQPTTVLANLSVVEIDPQQQQQHHLQQVKENMRQYARPEQWPQLEKQLQQSAMAPGAEEAALLERLCEEITGISDDTLLIVDTAPTGHTLRLLHLPEMMAAWTDGLLQHNQRAEQLGKVLRHLTPRQDIDNPLSSPSADAAALPRREQQLFDTLLRRQRLFRRCRRILEDARHSGFLFVVTPERLPVQETLRAIKDLDAEQIPVLGVVINQLLDEQDSSAFFKARAQQQQHHLAQLRQTLQHIDHYHLPLLAQDIYGVPALSALGQQLAGQR